MIDALRRLSVAHERSIGTLEAKSSFTWLLKSAEIQNEIWNTRDKWRRTQYNIWMDYHNAAPSDKPNKVPKHPLGSQRSIITAMCLKNIMQDVEANQPDNAEDVKKVIQGLQDKLRTSEQVDELVFRMKPKYEDPWEGRTWSWAMMLSDGASVELRRLLVKLPCPSEVAPARHIHLLLVGSPCHRAGNTTPSLLQTIRPSN